MVRLRGWQPSVSGRGLLVPVGAGKLTLADPRFSCVGFQRAWRGAAASQERAAMTGSFPTSRHLAGVGTHESFRF